MAAHEHHQHHASPRREKATRRAFFFWMAAYAAALMLVVALHSFGGIADGTAIDANGIRTQQARATGAPQSSLAIHPLPDVVRYDVDG